MSAAPPGREGTPPGAPQVQTLACPHCGAPLTVRSMGRAVTIVCDRCHSILDAKDPQLRILQRFEAATGAEVPLIPLGSRGCSVLTKDSATLRSTTAIGTTVA